MAHPGGGAVTQRHDDAQPPRRGDGTVGSGEEPQPHWGDGRYEDKDC